MLVLNKPNSPIFISCINKINSYHCPFIVLVSISLHIGEMFAPSLNINNGRDIVHMSMKLKTMTDIFRIKQNLVKYKNNKNILKSERCQVELTSL